MRGITTLLASLALLAPTSCSSGGGGGSSASNATGTGRITVEVTDSPFEHSMVEEALIRVDQVRVHASDSEESGWHVIHDGNPLAFDLLDLRNGVTRTLVSLADVPAGTYRKMRIRVHSAYLRLENGNEYTTDDETLRLTSTGTSGFKVTFDPPFEIRDGFSRTLLLDFDLTRTFHAIPASDPLNAAFYQLQPRIRTANLSESGELRGTVTDDGGETLVEDATVYVLPPGISDPEESVASTATDPNGSWVVIGLTPGTYDVLARKDELLGSALSLEVNAGSATAVELELE